jgi:hypothetical protein
MSTVWHSYPHYKHGSCREEEGDVLNPNKVDYHRSDFRGAVTCLERAMPAFEGEDRVIVSPEI